MAFAKKVFKEKKAMKKLLSVLLVAAMLVTTLVVATVSVSAVDGDWSVYTIKSQYLDDYSGYMSDIPGYEYTEEGLKMIPAPWKDSNPYATFQTTDKVNLKNDGVYLKVRVDQFTYTASDTWFGFSLWDDQNVQLGQQGGEYGLGVETLIRIHTGQEATYNEEDKNTWAGSMRGLRWYKDLEEGQRIECYNTANDKNWVNEFDENKCPIITIKVYWDSASEMYMININGVDAPSAYNQAATDLFHEEYNDEAYVGFSLQNNKVGGTIGCTILEFGTCTDDGETVVAAKPQGDDSKEPVAYSNEVEPIADPSEVAQGDPAIVLNASPIDSKVKGKPSSVEGNLLTVNDDNSLNVVGNSDNIANVKYLVANSVSYDSKDFPIALVITRNFCTCEYEDEDSDGNLDEICECKESINVLALAGNMTAEGGKYAVKNNAFDYWDAYEVGDDTYLYFTFDWSNITALEEVKDEDGNLRINGLRIDFEGLKGGERNSFDICEVAFFRTTEEAADYFEAYLEEISEDVVVPGEDEESESESQAPVESESESQAPAESESESKAPAESESESQAPAESESESQAPAESESESQAPAESESESKAPVASESESEEKTEEKTEAPEKEPATEAPERNGCGGVVGVGAIAVVAIVAAGFVSFKKKED